MTGVMGSEVLEFRRERERSDEARRGRRGAHCDISKFNFLSLRFKFQ